MDKHELFDAALETMQGLVRDTGPEAIIPLGGALIPYVVDPLDLQREVGVPVLNTKSISIRFAETCHALGLVPQPDHVSDGRPELRGLREPRVRRLNVWL